MNLKRDQLLTNCQKRGIDTTPTNGGRVTKAVLSQKLLDHVESMLEDEGQVLDETIYESCNEDLDQEEDEQDNDQTRREQQPKQSRPRSNTDPTANQGSGQSDMSQLTSMFQVLLDKIDQPRQNRYEYEDSNNSNYNYGMSGSHSQNFDNQAVTFEETLQEKIYQVSTSGSTRLLLRRHPHLESLPSFGYEFPKDLKEVKDWTLNRCVCAWEPEKNDTPHKQTLIQACARVPEIEMEPYEYRKSRQPQGSVLVRLINAVDAFYESSKGRPSRRLNIMSKAQLDNLLMTFQNHEVFNSLYPAKSQAGKSLRQNYTRDSNNRNSTPTCNAFNSSRGCSKSAASCQWPHHCNRCIKRGKEENHPGFRCSQN